VTLLVKLYQIEQHKLKPVLLFFLGKVKCVSLSLSPTFISLDK